MNDIVSMRKMQFGSEGADAAGLLESGSGDFVRGDKAVV
jgi:hypothetical protein